MDVRGIWEPDKAERSKLIFFRSFKDLSQKNVSSLLLEQIPFFFFPLSSFPLLLQGRLKGVKIHIESRTILMIEYLFFLVLSY